MQFWNSKYIRITEASELAGKTIARATIDSIDAVFLFTDDTYFYLMMSVDSDDANLVCDEEISTDCAFAYGLCSAAEAVTAREAEWQWLEKADEARQHRVYLELKAKFEKGA